MIRISCLAFCICPCLFIASLATLSMRSSNSPRNSLLSRSYGSDDNRLSSSGHGNILDRGNGRTQRGAYSPESPARNIRLPISNTAQTSVVAVYKELIRRFSIADCRWSVDEIAVLLRLRGVVDTSSLMYQTATEIALTREGSKKT